jgi:uncharacterized membrane protein (DUF373 family)
VYEYKSFDVQVLLRKGSVQCIAHNFSLSHVRNSNQSVLDHFQMIIAMLMWCGIIFLIWKEMSFTLCGTMTDFIQDTQFSKRLLQVLPFFPKSN